MFSVFLVWKAPWFQVKTPLIIFLWEAAVFCKKSPISSNWQILRCMFFGSLHTLILERGRCLMKEDKKRTTWEAFMQTGQVRDYLQYRKQEQEEMNPRRRMERSSVYKKFYK